MSAFVAVDLPALLAALLALAACGSLGTWLVLRRESMTADAVSHAVLPGLVCGFLVAGTRSVAAMLAGAAIAGVASVLMARIVRRRARTDAGTALGIVFTAMFALGVALLETQGARQVDLDPECVLFGSLESMFVVQAPGASWLGSLPPALWMLAGVAIAATAFSTLLAKELSALAFDQAFARHSGAAPRWLEPALLCMASAAIVVSFEAVGSVLVIALVACPALAAAPFARSATHQLALGLAIAMPLAALAYFAAAHAPSLVGTRTALNASGMIALFLALSVPGAHLARALIRRRA